MYLKPYPYLLQGSKTLTKEKEKEKTKKSRRLPLGMLFYNSESDEIFSRIINPLTYILQNLKILYVLLHPQWTDKKLHLHRNVVSK